MLHQPILPQHSWNNKLREALSPLKVSPLPPPSCMSPTWHCRHHRVARRSIRVARHQKTPPAPMPFAQSLALLHDSPDLPTILKHDPRRNPYQGSSSTYFCTKSYLPSFQNRTQTSPQKFAPRGICHFCCNNETGIMRFRSPGRCRRSSDTVSGRRMSAILRSRGMGSFSWSLCIDLDHRLRIQ